MLAALLTLAMLLVIIRLLAPKSSVTVRRLFPRADRGLDRRVRGQTERRGALLAALAAGNIAGVYAGADEIGRTLIAVGILAAILFRAFPEPTGMILGFLGVVSALQTAVGETCFGVADDRRVVAGAVVIVGVGAFALLRLIFTGSGLAKGSVSLLTLFGLIQLGTFVAAPFGFVLTELVGLGDSLIAVLALYGLVIVAAALMPDFAVSVIGVALLAALLTADTLVGVSCTGRQGAVIGVLLGFAAVWWIAGWLSRRDSYRH